MLQKSTLNNWAKMNARLTIPLEKRKSGILSQLDFFFSGSKSSHCNAHISPLRIPVVKQFGNSVTSPVIQSMAEFMTLYL